MGRAEHFDTHLIKPRLSKSRSATRAKEPLILNLSTMIAGVSTLEVTASLRIFSTTALSKVTAFADLSFTFPLDHFFFLFLPPAPDELPDFDETGSAFPYKC